MRREMRFLKRAREKKLGIKLPESRLTQCVNGVNKRDFLGASSRSYAAGEWMLEDREAVPTPLSGGTIAHSTFNDLTRSR